MFSIPQRWDESAQFALSRAGIHAVFKTAYDMVHRIIFFSTLIFFSGVISEVVSARYLSLAFQVNNIPIQTYMGSYTVWAIILFVPFLMQSVLKGRKPYGYYVMRWLMWYGLVLLAAFSIEIPFLFFIRVIPDQMYILIDGLQWGLLRGFLFLLPFTLMHYFKSGGKLSVVAFRKAALQGVMSLFNELPAVGLFGCMLLPLFYIRFSATVYNVLHALSPYMSTLFSLYVGIFVMQVAWGVQCALFHHRVAKK